MAGNLRYDINATLDKANEGAVLTDFKQPLLEALRVDPNQVGIIRAAIKDKLGSTDLTEKQRFALAFQNQYLKESSNDAFLNNVSDDQRNSVTPINKEFYSEKYDHYGITQNGMTFSPEETKSLLFSDMKKTYMNDHLATLSSGTQAVIQKIGGQILSQNNSRRLSNQNLIFVPVYAKGESKEGLKKTVDTIKEQSGDFKIVMYLNAFENDHSVSPSNLGAFDQSSMLEKESFLKNYIGSDDRFIVASHLYKERQPIGTIRADMIDGALTVHEGNGDPNLLFLDADTWKMDKNYIVNMEKDLSDPSVHYSCAQLRWTSTMGSEYKFVWFAEMLAQLGGLMQNKWGESVYASGGSAGMKRNDFLKIKGGDRSLWKGEDLAMGIMMQWYHGEQGKKNHTIGKWGAKKVYVDPRRGEDILTKGGMFHEQWNNDFNPIETGAINTSSIEEYNQMVGKLITNQSLTHTELGLLENFMERHCAEHPQVRSQLLKKFPIFWNKTSVAQGSLYKVSVVGNRLKFALK